jgi:hypothetical protein
MGADFEQLIAQVKKVRGTRNQAEGELRRLKPVLMAAKQAGVLSKEQAQQVGMLYGKQTRKPKPQPSAKK